VRRGAPLRRELAARSDRSGRGTAHRPCAGRPGDHALAERSDRGPPAARGAERSAPGRERARDERARRTQQEQIHVEFGKKYFVNAGSVGQPRDGDWRAAYCIYHADENLIEQRRVRYAIEKARKKIIAAGLPRLLADRLALGR